MFVLAQRRIDVAKLLGKFGGFKLGGGQTGLPKRHAAADVVADERGVKMVFAEKRCTDGITPPRMQIRHAGYAQYVRQLGGDFELSDGVAFNPGF